MKKPAGIIIVIVMNALKLVATLIPMLVLMAVAAMPETNEFKQGFEIGIGGSLDAGMLGEIVGRTTIYVLIMVLLFVAIFKRSYALTLGMLILQTLMSVRAPLGFVWSAIMLLIVLIGKRNKMYLKNTDTSLNNN